MEALQQLNRVTFEHFTKYCQFASKNCQTKLFSLFMIRIVDFCFLVKITIISADFFRQNESDEAIFKTDQSSWLKLLKNHGFTPSIRRHCPCFLDRRTWSCGLPQFSQQIRCWTSKQHGQPNQSLTIPNYYRHFGFRAKIQRWSNDCGRYQWQLW